MENRKFVKFLIPTLLLGFFIGNPAWAYEVEPHAFLTDAAFDFYNKNFEKDLSEDLRDYLIDGARKEDDMPRYMNHFYDPVNDRGLDDGIYSGYESKEWAQNDKFQKRLVYRIAPSTVASILSAIQLEKIDNVADQANFTWQKAIDLYIDGDMEGAFYALGHIIHLLEDAAVPDHTRNDAHPPFVDGGSPYENWTQSFSLKSPDTDLAGRLKNKKPILFSSLDSYFEGLAKYSNNNFYSEDSIKNYELPESDYFKKIDGDNFGLKKDSEFGDYYIAKKLIPDLLKPEVNKLTLQDDLILRDYWYRLSTKSVQYAAGVINLFLKEAERAKANYEARKAQRPYLSTLIDGFKGLFGSEEDQPALVVDIARDSGKSPEGDAEEGEGRGDLGSQEFLNGGDESPTPEPVAPLSSIGPIGPIRPIGPINPIKPIEQTTPANNTDTIPTEIVALQLCGFNTLQTPSHQGVIINEVAWMGSVNSANDEWIELRNISGSELDLSGWQLVDMGEQIKVQLDGKIPASGFYLLERTDDSSVPTVTADKIYTGALNNAGEGLRLFNKNCELVDEVMAAPDWPAPTETYILNRHTMERASDFAWRTSSDIGGTPKAENSLGRLPMINSGGGGGSQSGSSPSASQDNNQSNQENQPASDETENQPSEESPAPVQENTAANHLVISEILFDAEGSDAGKEFIELYNPTGQAFDLSSWSIQHLSSTGTLTKKNFEASDAIAAKRFFLIWLGSDPRADMQWSSGSLNNTSATLYLVDNQDLVSTTSPISVDSVSYDTAMLSGFTAGQSIERKAFENSNCVSSQSAGEYLGNGCDTDSSAQDDFELRVIPNPQNTQSLPEPRSAPVTVGDFEVSYNSGSLELNFSWDESVDAVGDSSTLTYGVSDVSSASSTVVYEGADTAFNKTLTEIGREYNFEIIVSDKDGLTSEAASTSVSAPSYFSSLDFYQDPAATTSPKYLLALDWDSYPFIPILLPHLASGQYAPKNWHAAIFYYNQEAPATDDLWWINYNPEAAYRSWGLTAPNGFKIQYPACNGVLAGGASLILPDTEDACNAMAGNYASYAINWLDIQNPPILLEAMANNFTNSTPIIGQDYVAVAFYAFQPGYEPNNSGLGFLAADKTKYYFKGVP